VFGVSARLLEEPGASPETWLGRANGVLPANEKVKQNKKKNRSKRPVVEQIKGLANLFFFAFSIFRDFVMPRRMRQALNWLPV
jgi:hypothetical protein